MPDNQTTAEMWAITGSFGLNDEPERFFYCGTYLSRRSAIKTHTAETGVGWKACYRKGDRAVRVRVTEIANA